MKKLLLLTTLLLHSLYGVVTITPVELGEDPGLSAKVGLSLATKKGNSDVESYKAAGRVTYDNNVSYVTWFQVAGEYGEANKEKNVQNLYAHLRYIHNITDRYHVWEAALQTQEDEFRLINRRRLVALGYRQRFFPASPELKAYVGIGAMYEYIDYLESDDTALQNPSEHNGRISAYASLSYAFKKDTTLGFISYMQPKFDDFGDFVTLNELELRFNIVKELFLLFSLKYTYDAKPPLGIASKYDFSQNTSFVYKF